MQTHCLIKSAVRVEHNNLVKNALKMGQVKHTCQEHMAPDSKSLSSLGHFTTFLQRYGQRLSSMSSDTKAPRLYAVTPMP